jgi:hypothetical protein
MSYLRFSPEEYRAICRLAKDIPLSGADLPALKHFLVAYLPLDQLRLAKRIGHLDNRQMRVLYEHLKDQRQAGAVQSGRHAFTAEELKMVGEACDSLLYPVRFLRFFRNTLVEHLHGIDPSLARKLGRLSERQFERLYEHLKGRRKGSA